MNTNAIVYHSNTGQSQAVAVYLADQLGYPLVDVEAEPAYAYGDLVLVFPVHCQNIPDIVKDFLRRVTVESLTVIATYGKMGCGNVLYEIQRDYHLPIVAGAYIPTKHAYIDRDEAFSDFDRLIPLIEKIKRPATVQLPKLYKSPPANLFPKLRSQLGVSIVKTADCRGCNLCAARCRLGAIERGTTNARCIRCLKCVRQCPHQALQAHIHWPLRVYLRKKKVDQLIIYV